MANIERVKYQNSPLIEVIFQLVFPTTLSINSQIPVEFQNSVKEKYPIYKEGVARETKVLMMPDGKPKNIMGTESKKYNFISQDGFSKVVLTSFYVSLSTLRYTQWEEFKEKVNFVIETFHRIYSPNVYTRIGLRYVNAIRKNKLGLNGVTCAKLWIKISGAGKNPYLCDIINNRRIRYGCLQGTGPIYSARGGIQVI